MESVPSGSAGQSESRDGTVSAFRLRHAIVEALLWEDWGALRRHVRALCDVDMTAAILAVTRVGSLLVDASLDAHLG